MLLLNSRINISLINTSTFKEDKCIATGFENNMPEVL